MSATPDTTVDAATGEVVEGAAVEVVPRNSATLFHTNDPVEVIAKASEIADALKDVISRKGLYQNISGKSHVLVEGWTLLGSMLGVSAVVTSTAKLENGWKAHVEARTIDGRVVGAADAICTRDENRWKTASDYAVLGMAQTRATSRALRGPLGFIVNLAGYSPTGAEEMPSDTADGSALEAAAAVRAAPSASAGQESPPPRAQTDDSKRQRKQRASELVAAAMAVGIDGTELHAWAVELHGDDVPSWTTRNQAIDSLAMLTADETNALYDGIAAHRPGVA